LTLTFCFGCRPTSDSVPKGAYAYTSYDSSGASLARGWFTIVVSDSTSISGEWHFDPIGSPEKIGPQTGNGKLVGGIDGQKIWIELHPEVRNNNLQLNGILVNDRVDGQWTWLKYDGIGNQGVFHAVKK